MAFQPVRWHKICCLHYEGCLTIKRGKEVAALHDSKNVGKVFAHMSGRVHEGVLSFWALYWCLFHPLQHNRVLPVIQKAFVVVGSTVVALGMRSPVRATIQPDFLTDQGENV